MVFWSVTDSFWTATDLFWSWTTASLNALNKSYDLEASTAGASTSLGASTIFSTGFWSICFYWGFYSSAFFSTYYGADLGAWVGFCASAGLAWETCTGAVVLVVFLGAIYTLFFSEASLIAFYLKSAWASASSFSLLPWAAIDSSDSPLALISN